MTTTEARAIVEEFSSLPPNAGAAEITRLKGALMNAIGQLTNHVDTLYAEPDKAPALIKAAKAEEDKKAAEAKRAAEAEARRVDAARVAAGGVPIPAQPSDPQADRDEAHRRAEFGTNAEDGFDDTTRRGPRGRDTGHEDVTGHEDADARVRAARKRP